MKKRQLFLGLATIAAAVFSFSSCSQDELSTAKAETPNLGQEILLSTNFSTTRSVSQNIQNAQIASGIQVGTFITTTGSTTGFVTNGNNKPFTADGSGGLTVSGDKVYYPNNANADIYAYAPFQSGWNVTDVNADQNFTVQADQSSDDNYKASDLIWATPLTNKESSTSALALGFFHKLSKINVNITNNRTGLSLKGAQIFILNTKPTVPINLKTGDLGTASGSVTEITAATLATGVTEPTATASAIIVPQPLAAGTNFIKIVTDATYNNSVSTTLYAKLGAGGKTFASANQYSYTVTINQQSVELSLGGTTISAWTDNQGELEAEDAPAVGDYILNDGTFLKNNAVTNENKANIVAVIFSTTPHDTGYNGYAVSIEGKLGTNTLAWATSTGLVGTAVNTCEDALSDYIGLERRNTFSGDFTTHPAFECSGAPAVTGANLSAWFIPSVAQFVDIIQNLGEVSGIRSTINTAYSDGQTNNNNISVPKEPASGFLSFLSKINAYAVAVKGSGNVIITASGDGSNDSNCFGYVTASEKDETKMWMIKFPAQDAANQRIYLSRGADKTGTSNRNILPILAFKLSQ